MNKTKKFYINTKVNVLLGDEITVQNCHSLSKKTKNSIICSEKDNKL